MKDGGRESLTWPVVCDACALAGRKADVAALGVLGTARSLAENWQCAVWALWGKELRARGAGRQLGARVPF